MSRTYNSRNGFGKRWNDGSRGGVPLPQRVLYLRMLMQGRLKGRDAIVAIERIQAEREQLRREREKELRALRRRPMPKVPLTYMETACADEKSLHIWRTYQYLENPATRSQIRLAFVLEGVRCNISLEPVNDYDPDMWLDVVLSPKPVSRKPIVLAGNKEGLFWTYKNHLHCRPQKPKGWLPVEMRSPVIESAPMPVYVPEPEPTPPSYRAIEQHIQEMKAQMSPEQLAEHERRVRELLGR